MRTGCCYCDSREDAQRFCVTNTFAILACKEHAAAAAEDLADYLHRNSMVRIADVKAACPAFFAALDAAPFAVHSDPGWTRASESREPQYIFRRDELWYLRVEKGQIEKAILLASFERLVTDTDILAHLDALMDAFTPKS